MTAKVWLGGAVVDGDKAQVSVFDRGFLYGDSVYEVLRTFSSRPFALVEHLMRLEQSAAQLEMGLPSRDVISQAVLEVIAAIAEPDIYLRIVVTRGAGDLALDPARADAPRLIVIGKSIDLPSESLYKNGATVAVVGRSRSSPGSIDPSIKSGNYLASVLATREAKRRGAYEALLSDDAGRVTEGASSNLFLVRAGHLVTPPISAGILSGITREKVIELARAAGIRVEEGEIWPKDIAAADEAFITSSIRGVLPIVGVDGTAIGAGVVGPVTRRILERYDGATR